MALHMFLILLIVCIIFSQALLWPPGWLHLQPSHSKVGAVRTTVPHLLIYTLQQILAAFLSPALYE
jgi:hypothetical protein